MSTWHYVRRVVNKGELSAGKKEREIKISFCDGVPSCKVIVDGGWSK